MQYSVIDGGGSSKPFESSSLGKWAGKTYKTHPMGYHTVARSDGLDTAAAMSLNLKHIVLEEVTERT